MERKKNSSIYKRTVINIEDLPIKAKSLLKTQAVRPTKIYIRARDDVGGRIYREKHERPGISIIYSFICEIEELLNERRE